MNTIFLYLCKFCRLSINISHQSVRNISCYKPLLFKTTPTLFGEPLKRKKKVDPALVKAREDRKKRKLEKQIKRMEKHARQMKPLDELEVPLVLVEGKEKRKRPQVSLTLEEKEGIALLHKDWTRYKTMEHINSIKNIDRILSSQRRALEALKEVSEELYNEAIQPDLNLENFSFKGTLSTPPIKKYDAPDGEYTDISKKWIA